MSIAGNVGLEDLPRICPLISRRVQSAVDIAETRVVTVGKVLFGGPRPVIIAGPCAVESREQTLAVARAVKAAGANMLRGGAFKPRTSPHDFQGMGVEGLRILREAGDETGLPIVTEVMDPRLLETVCAYADMLQIGSRNMQNYPLLVEAGKSGKPVLLKRGMAASLCEWLGAAEYIAKEGNLEIVLCERGIKAFPAGEYSRNVLDLSVIPAVKAETFLPVIVDPSHATGVSSMVESASCAAIAAGSHGLIIEVADDQAGAAKPQCDAVQAIFPGTLKRIVQFVDSRVEQSSLRKAHAV
ncbi:MAG TPA: 3-deoxy-7-phosphoheptulonate synthase [Candidatus Eremiobacteraceae bacterium]|nr:3-deoxy-7-phosphoheptulonate synthase [Candidatus Eremiobacteraceae bacterium]